MDTLDLGSIDEDKIIEEQFIEESNKDTLKTILSFADLAAQKGILDVSDLIDALLFYENERKKGGTIPFSNSPIERLVVKIREKIQKFEDAKSQKRM